MREEKTTGIDRSMDLDWFETKTLEIPGLLLRYTLAVTDCETV